jgi:MFS family permease
MVFGLMNNSGAICGAPAAAWVADRFGRRVGMFLGGLIILVGMAIAASAKTIAQVGHLYALPLTSQFTVGRFVLGLGISLMTICAPAYATEVAPPHWRGRATAFYNIGWYGGAIPAAAITCERVHPRSLLH